MTSSIPALGIPRRIPLFRCFPFIREKRDRCDSAKRVGLACSVCLVYLARQTLHASRETNDGRMGRETSDVSRFSGCWNASC